MEFPLIFKKSKAQHNSAGVLGKIFSAQHALLRAIQVSIRGFCPFINNQRIICLNNVRWAFPHQAVNQLYL